MSVLRPLPWQERFFSLPESVSVAMLSARGGGKSWAAAMAAVRHCHDFGSDARVLIARESYPALSDIVATLRQLLLRGVGDAASYNAQSHIWTLPGPNGGPGGSIELGYLATREDLRRYIGKQYGLIVVEEVTQLLDIRMVDELLGCLRAPPHVPVRMVVTGNPGGRLHHIVRNRWITAVDRGRSGPTTRPRVVLVPVELPRQPHINPDEYERALEGATRHDAALREAWIDGDWNVVRGAYFGDVIGPWTELAQPWPVEFFDAREECDPQLRQHDPVMIEGRWSIWIGMDLGISAPSVCLVMASPPDDRGGVGPDGVWYPAGRL